MITAKYESRSRFISAKGGDKDYKKVVGTWVSTCCSISDYSDYCGRKNTFSKRLR